MRTLLLVLIVPVVFGIACRSKQGAAAVDPVAPAGTAASTPARTPAPTAAPVVPVPPVADVEDVPAGEVKALRTDGPADSLYFSLERTPCFGRCPTYKVRINNDGTATYQGIRSVEREGTFTGKMDRAGMDALFARATAIGFFSMKDRYDSDVTDLPSAIIRISANGQDKKVTGRSGTPMAFKAFATYADSVIAQVTWVKVEEGK